MGAQMDKVKEDIDVKKVVVFHCVSNGEKTKGWVHTHGLAKFRLPELEIRGVPLFLAIPATNILIDIADHLLNSGKKVNTGETFSLGDHLSLNVQLRRAVPIEGMEEHYADERWEIVDASTGLCAECGINHGESGEHAQKD